MNIQHFKDKLLEERRVLHEEIEGLGTMKIAPGDYEAEADTAGMDKAEEIELANMFEVEQTKDAVLDQLENRLMDVERALSKIETNEYGTCEIDGGLIEEVRLEANPAARTCIEHKEEVLV